MEFDSQVRRLLGCDCCGLRFVGSGVFVRFQEASKALDQRLMAWLPSCVSCALFSDADHNLSERSTVQILICFEGVFECIYSIDHRTYSASFISSKTRRGPVTIPRIAACFCRSVKIGISEVNRSNLQITEIGPRVASRPCPAGVGNYGYHAARNSAAEYPSPQRSGCALP